jgi:hypothetical protein
MAIIDTPSPKPYSLLKHLFWSAFLNSKEKVHVVVLSTSEFSGYFDDSGHPDDQPAVIIAGFVASKDQWLAFDDEWNELLAVHGIPFFHMAQFEQGHGVYGRWNDKKKRKFLDKAVTIISTNVDRPFTQLVDMNDYRKINELYPFEECFGAPYAFSGWLIYSQLEVWRVHKNKPKIMAFFENGSKHKGDFQQIAAREGIPEPNFLEKMDATPLQAADMLAWEYLKFIKTGAAFTKKVRNSLNTLIAASLARHEMPIQGSTFRLMEKLCEDQKIPRRDDIHPASTFLFENSPKRNRRRTVFLKP